MAHGYRTGSSWGIRSQDPLIDKVSTRGAAWRQHIACMRARSAALALTSWFVILQNVQGSHRALFRFCRGRRVS